MPFALSVSIFPIVTGTFVHIDLDIKEGIITAIIGSPRVYEDSKNPNMQRQIAHYGKTKARIINAIGGLILAAVGAWLLYGWLFVPQP